jgi:glycine cleavage system transcriptional repressor
MAAREFLLLSATEPDRSGLVAELTGFIADCGCNVEDSRVVVLGGYAGLMVLVSGEHAELQSVLDGLEQLRARTGIRASPRRVAARVAQASSAFPRMVVQASAIDHEGIIHALAETVRRYGGNILELESATESAPMSGEPLLRLRMGVWVAQESDGDERLWKELEAVARQEGVELEIRPVRSSADVTWAIGPERRAVDRESPGLA